jgi:aerobic carbon-monoxide dehydrogenase large subunit
MATNMRLRQQFNAETAGSGQTPARRKGLSMVLSRYVGARVRRKEDPRLITGRSTYVDDLHLAGMLHVAIVRSPYAHARITGIDAEAALAMPGVARVLTGRECRQIMQPVHIYSSEVPLEDDEVPEGSIKLMPIAIERARYVGEPVAAVVAETPLAARDAADAVVVDYEPLEAITDPEEALKDGAPQLYDDTPNNIAATYEHKQGDVDAAFAEADITVKVRIKSQRLAGIPLETRGVAAAPDPLSGGLTVWTSTQAPHNNRRELAESLSMPTSQIRVVAPEVGGGFGVKIGNYPEDFIVAALARDMGRPLKWVESRSENLLTTHHGRAQIGYLEAAADNTGKITGLRMNLVQDVGSYPRDTGNMDLTCLMGVGCYDIPAVDQEATGVYTNTMAVGAYRGAGRPEAAYYIERIVEMIADEGGLDPVEIRRLNFIQPHQFPYVTSAGERYDTGEYEKALDKALEVSGYSELRAEQAELRQQGRYIGIGLASYVEICGFGPYDSSTVRVDPNGAVRVFTGISPHGQGQETTFAQLVVDHLGANFDDIFVHHGDTSNTPQGRGTMGSRGLAVGGGALMKSIAKVKDKALRIAALLLEASIDDVEMSDGAYRVKGSPDRTVTLAEIAKEAYTDDLPEGMDPGLESTDYFAPPDEVFPFGTHVAVVEVFPDTGKVQMLKYFSIDDCGPRISPMLVEGQVHGGLAQGIAQALFEEMHYDAAGQLLTGSLMDYAIPKASHLINFTLDKTVTTTPINPLGVKGIGEAATIGSTPAIANAVVDALEPFGIRHIDVPMTPERVWRAIQDASSQA